jgi:hypothetical protein
MPLNPKQQSHIAGAFPETRHKMTDYLARGVEVVVFRQNECVDAVPPYAVAPVEKRDFWIGCWGTVEQAAVNAIGLGLRVVLDEPPEPSAQPILPPVVAASPTSHVIELVELQRRLEAAYSRVLGLMRDARDLQRQQYHGIAQGIQFSMLEMSLIDAATFDPRDARIEA